MKLRIKFGSKKHPLIAIAALTWVLLLGLKDNAFAQQRSTNSENQLENAERGIAEIDQTVEAMMEKIGATSASLAVLREGVIVYSRGYGFNDRRVRNPTTPSNIFRLASCSKPFTAATIRKLIKQGDLAESTLIYDFLGIAPTKELQDARVKKITIKDLLDHKGGWNRNTTFYPLYMASRIQQELKVSRMKKHHIVRYMWDRPLQFEPGSEVCYSNFGYLLLGLAIEKATGKSYIESVRELIAEPLGIDNLVISSEVKKNRKNQEVHYPSESKLNLHLRDSSSGLATSPESLCKFMKVYYLDGRLRGTRNNRYFFQFGSHPHTTTALMEQRLDGIAFAVLLNRRLEETYMDDNEKFRNELNRAIDNTKSKFDN